MKDSEDIQRLIRLKKYETPGDEYFKNFLEDFKDRQRGEMLQQSARGLLFERVTMWFDELSGPPWLLPVGATAAAAIALGIYAIRPVISENGVPGTGIASITENSLPLARETDSTLSATAPMDEQVISLQLPRRDQRVPGLGNSGHPEVQGLLPTSARALYREL